MEQITFEVYTDEDIRAVVALETQAWADWSVSTTDTIQNILDRMMELESVNIAQNKRINALKSRVTALEETIASGVYNDSY